MKFKINIGKAEAYIPNASLDLPDSNRIGVVWSTGDVGGFVGAVIACTSGSVPNEYSLQINSDVAGTHEMYYAHNSGTVPFHSEISNVRGYTIEVQKKVVDAGDTHGQVVFWQDDKFQEFMCFGTGYVGLGKATTTYIFTTTDDFHTYRVNVRGTEVKLYVDEVLRITETLATASDGGGNMGIYVGDVFGTANYGGESRYGYFKYITSGAYSPNETIEEGWVYSNFDFSDTRATKEKGIIRSDKNITPESKMKASRLTIKGTVVGSCWNSFRATVRRFKSILQQGIQNIYIDDYRYIEGIHNKFQLKPETQDYAKFTASFLCRYPYWNETWASYYSTAPVAGATFYIVNDSDIEVPCKVIFTGLAASTTSEFILTNATLAQSCRYSGVLNPTTELVVDKGFDEYNTYKVMIGTADVFSSYEGELFTLQSGENAFVLDTGVNGGAGAGEAIGTIEVYYRKAYLL